MKCDGVVLKVCDKYSLVPGATFGRCPAVHCTATLERCQPAAGWTHQLLQVGNEKEMGETVACIVAKKNTYWVLMGKPETNHL